MAPNTGNWVTTTSINCTRNVRATGWSEDWNGWDSRFPSPREPNNPFACRNPQPLSGNEVDPVNAANAQFLANTLPENQEFSKDWSEEKPLPERNAGKADIRLTEKEMKWSGREDSNLRPPGPEPGALPG